MPDLAYAQSRFKVKLINTGAAIGASSVVQKFASLFDGGGADENEFTLPNYDHVSG